MSKMDNIMPMWVDAKQKDVMSPRQVVLHVRCVLQLFERQGNHGFRGGSIVLCSVVRLLNVHLKSHLG